MRCKGNRDRPRRRAGAAAAALLLAALAGLTACEGGGTYQAPAYNLDRCFWEPWLPNC
jgi:hypothetical protein